MDSLERNQKLNNWEIFTPFFHLLIGSASKLNLENLEVYVPDQIKYALGVLNQSE